MAWNEIDRDTSITWLQATTENLYEQRQNGDRAEIAMYEGTPRQWVTLEPPGSAGIVQLTSSYDQLITVGDDGVVSMQDGEQWSDLHFPTKASAVVARDDGALFGIDESFAIFAALRAPDQWEKIDDLVESDGLAVAGGTLYKRMAHGSIWRYTGTPMTGWKRVDNNPTTVNIFGGGKQLLQMHDNGRLFQLEPGSGSHWTTIDGTGHAVDVVAHGDRIFQRRDDGHVLQYSGVPSKPWKDLHVDGDSAALLAVGPRSVYVYNGNRVYRNDL